MVVSARTYADFTPQATFDIKVSLSDQQLLNLLCNIYFSAYTLPFISLGLVLIYIIYSCIFLYFFIYVLKEINIKFITVSIEILSSTSTLILRNVF